MVFDIDAAMDDAAHRLERQKRLTHERERRVMMIAEIDRCLELVEKRKRELEATGRGKGYAFGFWGGT